MLRKLLFLQLYFRIISLTLAFCNVHYISLLLYASNYKIAVKYKKGENAQMKFKRLFKKKSVGLYRIFRQTMYNPDIGKYKTYGIKYSKKIVINDVSCNLAETERILRYLNRLQISPAELAEFIESSL